MGKDNQPKARQAAKLARKKARRAPYERILIVSEGSKTEPHYFGEIRAYYGSILRTFRYSPAC